MRVKSVRSHLGFEEIVSQFDNLSTAEVATVKSKLESLNALTWKNWDYAVTQQPGVAKTGPLLEIIVDGRTSKPIELPHSTEMPAEVICMYLDNFARKYMGPQNQ